jgi:hypothetical protein
MRTEKEFIDIIEKWGFYKWDRGLNRDYEWVHSSGRWIIHIDRKCKEYSLLNHFGDSQGVLDKWDDLKNLLRLRDDFIKLNRNARIAELISDNPYGL